MSQKRHWTTKAGYSHGRNVIRFWLNSNCRSIRLLRYHHVRGSITVVQWPHVVETCRSSVAHDGRELNDSRCATAGLERLELLALPSFTSALGMSPCGRSRQSGLPDGNGRFFHYGATCQPPPSALISATVASRRCPSRLSAVRSLASCAACTVVTLR